MGFHSPLKALLGRGGGEGATARSTNLLTNNLSREEQKVRKSGPAYSSIQSFLFKSEEGLAWSRGFKNKLEIRVGTPKAGFTNSSLQPGAYEPQLAL